MPRKKIVKEEPTEKFEFEDTEESVENDAPEMDVLVPLTLKCVTCGKEFLMIPTEQKFYKSRGFEIPKRCKDCREKKVSNVTEFTCVDCGAKFTMNTREVEFFEKNNLQLPKRCKQCRDFKRMRNEGKL